MNNFKVGDRVRIKDRTDWPAPPGYRLANAEGVVSRIWEEAGPGASREYVAVRFNHIITGIDLSHPFNFRREALEKL
jgi:hypothetical protein